MSWICPRPCQNKNEYGYCLTSWCLYPQVSNHVPVASMICTPDHVTIKFGKPTNADRIRSMSDEELAELLRDNQCNTCAWQGNDCDYADECKAEKLEMLKQEARG